MNQLPAGSWKKNWEKFYAKGKGERQDESQASRDREVAIMAERGRVKVQWMKNNPGKTFTDADIFLNLLFEPNPGNKSYPFKNKSLPSNGVVYINPVYGKAILHAADQAAGGGSETIGLGGARENSSIGAQWDRGGRAKLLKSQLDTEIDSTINSGVEKTEVEKMKLNVGLPVEDR